MELGGLFGKKKEIQPPGPQPGAGMAPGLARGLTSGKENPPEMVKRMRGQGMNNQQIVEALNREGFSQTQIYDAMDTATQMERDSTQKPGPAQGGPQPPVGPPGGPGAQPPQMMPPGGQTQAAPQQSQAPSAAKLEQVDELIERTVQEKWHEFTGELKKIEEFRGSVESRLASAEAKLDSLDQKFDNLKNAIIAKIKDYDTSILNVGTEMKAMEQVFQKILPELHENVSELSRVTSKLGAKKPAVKK